MQLSNVSSFLDWLNPATLYPAAMGFIRAIAIILAAVIAKRFIVSLLPTINARVISLMRHRARGDTVELEKRATTITGILRGTITIVVWSVALIMALRELGFDIAPILAGAGVVGLAVGFGAQNLVRDMITGLFMLLENQIRLNDVVVINDTGGLVEQINLRTTVLRDFDGTVHIFPNGSIQKLSNKTHDYGYYVLDAAIAGHKDLEAVENLLQEIGDEMRRDSNYASSILEPIEVLGMESFGDGGVKIKARMKTVPMAQWRVGRELNRRIRQRMEGVIEGIKLGSPLFQGTNAP
jgi:small-conductance mechanosensitive channel